MLLICPPLQCSDEDCSVWHSRLQTGPWLCFGASRLRVGVIFRRAPHNPMGLSLCPPGLLLSFTFMSGAIVRAVQAFSCATSHTCELPCLLCVICIREPLQLLGPGSAAWLMLLMYVSWAAASGAASIGCVRWHTLTSVLMAACLPPLGHPPSRWGLFVCPPLVAPLLCCRQNSLAWPIPLHSCMCVGQSS